MKRFFLFLGALLLIGVGCKGRTGEVQVSLSHPVDVAIGEEFDIRVEIKNTDVVDHRLDSIDISTSYQEGIVLVSSDPAYADTFHIPVDNMTSNTYDLVIAAGTTQTIRFSAIAYSTGSYTGNFDVCIDSDITCQTLAVATRVDGNDDIDLTLDLEDYVLTVHVPDQVKVGEVAEIQAIIENKKNEEAVLDSIDIAEAYLAGIEVSSAEPSFTDFFTLDVDDTRSHQFLVTIPAHETLTVTFYGTAVEPGTYAGSFDVCMDVGYNCFFEQIQTTVVE